MASAPETTDGKYANHLFFGIFICLVGLALLLVALSSSSFWLVPPTRPNDPAVLSGSLIFYLVLTTIGVALIFVGAHAPAYAPDPLTILRLRGRVQLVRRWQIGGLAFLVGIGLCAFTASRILDLAGSNPAPQEPPVSHFALALPLSDIPAGEGRAAPRAGSFSADSSAVLFWTVPPASAPQNAGLLPMLLASFLTIGFGLVYPRVALSGDEEGKGFVQKLVVPALGMALFGFGASENVNAEETRQDIHLVSQGLRPVAGLSGRERQAFLRNPNEISDAGSRQLAASMDALIEALEKQEGNPGASPGTVSPDDLARSAVAERIADLRAELADGRTLSDRRRASEFRQLRSELAENFRQANPALQRIAVTSEGAAEAGAAAAEQDRRDFCRMYRAQLASQIRQQDLIFELFDRQDERDAQNLLQRVWIGLKGMDRQRQQQRRDAYLSNAQDLTRGDRAEMESFCHGLATEGAATPG